MDKIGDSDTAGFNRKESKAPAKDSERNFWHTSKNAKMNLTIPWKSWKDWWMPIV